MKKTVRCIKVTANQDEHTHTSKLSEPKFSLLPLREQMLPQDELLSDELLICDSFSSWGPHASMWQLNNPMSCGCHMK